MSLKEFLTPSTILANLRVATKKQALLEMSACAGRTTGIDARLVYDSLNQREGLGSTGIGRGIAIPHGKLAGVRQITGVFARLEKPVDYGALDNAPVDLVFLLLGPEGAGAAHLKALARVARLLREPNIAAQIRAARDASTLYSMLTQAPASFAA